MKRILLALVVSAGLASSAFALSGGTHITVTNGTVAFTGLVTSAEGGTGANNTATTGRYLRGDGTNFVTSSVAAAGAGTCTAQFVRATVDNAAPTCATVSLTADVSGTLPLADGGGLTTATDDSISVGNGTILESKAITNCTGTGKAVTYATASNTFGCNTISSGAPPVLGLGTLGTITQGTTLYAGIGTGNISATEIDIETPVNAHTLQNLQCYTSVAPGGADTVTTTFGKGTCGAALTYTSSPTCAVSAAGKTCSDVSTTFSPTIGQCLAAKIVSSATAATSILSCTIDITA